MGTTIIELKTGQKEPWHAVQVAAYWWLVNHTNYDVSFCEENHEYSVGNKKIPSVSQVIRLYCEPKNYVRDWVVDQAIDRGQRYHKAIERWIDSGITPGSMAEDVGDIVFSTIDELCSFGFSREMASNGVPRTSLSVNNIPIQYAGTPDIVTPQKFGAPAFIYYADSREFISLKKKELERSLDIFLSMLKIYYWRMK